MAKFKPNAANIAKLKQKIALAYGNVIETLDAEYDAVIEDPNEFSDLGFDSQDIIDTGRFKDSKLLDVRTENDRINAHWSWNPTDPETGYHYAAALYTGFMAYGKKWIPGRPWPDRAIARVDPPKALQAEMKLQGIPAKTRKRYTF